ncbi:Uncharacterised protein [Salmonella enterica]|nr:Uncharacterised protein [Salmonella enterica]
MRLVKIIYYTCIFVVMLMVMFFGVLLYIILNHS